MPGVLLLKTQQLRVKRLYIYVYIYIFIYMYICYCYLKSIELVQGYEWAAKLTLRDD